MRNNITCQDCHDTGVVSILSRDTGKVEPKTCDCVHDSEKLYGEHQLENVEDAISLIELGYTS